MNHDWGGPLGASFSKGPGYTFPTKTNEHRLPPDPAAPVAAGHALSLLRAVLPELEVPFPCSNHLKNEPIVQL